MGDDSDNPAAAPPVWRLLAAQPAAVDGVALELAARPRAVIAALLLAPNAVVSTDRLADRLWGEDPPKTARNSIARFVADARKAMGPLAYRVHTEGGGYRIDVRPGELDVEQVRGAIDEAAATEDHTVAIDLARAALDLFGSDGDAAIQALHDTTAEGRAHEELRVSLIETLGSRSLDAGEHALAVPELERAVDAFPYHEQLWALLMRALYRSNRQADALRTFQRLAAVLDEIGLQPAPEVRRLEAEILAQQEIGGEAVAEPSPATEPPPTAPAPTRPARATEPSQHSLPQPRTSLVGREDDVAAIVAALDANRLVTIVGIGGMGKTRTAIAVANAIAADPSTAVHTVALRTVDDEARLVPTLAAVLGAYGDAIDDTDPGAIVRNIGAQPMLIVLDNCEHLADGAGRLADAILDGAPNARVLLTSRVPLDLDGEYVHRLAPLDLPTDADDSARSPAVALLLERARAQVVLDATDETRRDLAELTRALHGLPLAIELAAVQLAHQTPAELHARIEAVGITDLTDARGNAVLDEVLDWAWTSLSPEQQELLAGSTVFGGSWSLDAAEAVAGRPVSNDLGELVRRGLVVMNPVGGRARYEMLEPIREWAVRHVDEETGAERRDALVAWLESLVDRWTYNERDNLAEPARAFASEHDNFTVALEHLHAAGERERLLWLAVGAAPHWNSHGFSQEAIRWLAPVANDEALPNDARSAAAAQLAGAYSTQSNGENLVEWALLSLELAGDDALPWVPHNAALLGLHRLTFSFPGDLVEFFDRSRDAVRDPIGEAVSATWEAMANLMMLRSEEALGFARRALALCDRPGRILLFAEQVEATALMFLGRDDEALESTRNWRSETTTDEWHYTIETVRAAIRAHVGEAEEATVDLDAVVASLPAASVMGRAVDFQLAFGLLAHFRGDDELAEELLSVVAPLHPILMLIVVRNYAIRHDLNTPEGWIQSHLEFASRIPDPDLTGAPSGKLAGVVLRGGPDDPWLRPRDRETFHSH